MTDKQIIGGRGSAKPYTTLNTIEVMLENEDLKEQLDYLKETNEGLLSIQYKLADSNKKLRQALTEIQEIAENVIKNVSDRCIETTPMYGVHKHILQICDEVNDERNSNNKI